MDFIEFLCDKHVRYLFTTKSFNSKSNFVRIQISVTSNKYFLTDENCIKQWYKGR